MISAQADTLKTDILVVDTVDPAGVTPSDLQNYHFLGKKVDRVV